MPTRHGHAHLTLWSALHAGDVRGLLAVVTETGHGLSITNGMNHIWTKVSHYAGGRPVTLIEHWPANLGADQAEHLDEAWVEPGGRPAWRRIWPTGPNNPDHDLLSVWAAEHVPPLLEQAHLALSVARDRRPE
ncbi:hypothetical protein ACGFJC_47705 [Nonomuraea fuscirosea]|uniref:hypothetical protein n=1 Tax=Nonomuraea fuscirosea TaxID=1291556 RepID=UPI003722D90F